MTLKNRNGKERNECYYSVVFDAFGHPLLFDRDLSYSDLEVKERLSVIEKYIDMSELRMLDIDPIRKICLTKLKF